MRTLSTLACGTVGFSALPHHRGDGGRQAWMLALARLRRGGVRRRCRLLAPLYFCLSARTAWTLKTYALQHLRGTREENNAICARKTSPACRIAGILARNVTAGATTATLADTTRRRRWRAHPARSGTAGSLLGTVKRCSVAFAKDWRWQDAAWRVAARQTLQKRGHANSSAANAW